MSRGGRNAGVVKRGGLKGSSLHFPKKQVVLKIAKRYSGNKFRTRAAFGLKGDHL